MLTAEKIEAVRGELATAFSSLERAAALVFAEAMRGRDQGEATYIRRYVKRAIRMIEEAEQWVESEARCLEEHPVFCKLRDGGSEDENEVHSTALGSTDGPLAIRKP